MEEFREKEEDLNAILKRLKQLLSEAIEKISEEDLDESLKNKAMELLRENEEMLSGEQDRESILKHIEKVKTFLKRISEIEKEEEREETLEEEDAKVLKEDIGLIEQILEEEIPQAVTHVETKPERATVTILSEEAPLEQLYHEIETIKEYLRVLSDKIFDLGDELIELKEKVLKLEKVMLGEEEVKKVKKVAPEKLKKIKEEAEKELEYLVKNVMSVIGRKDENPIKRAIKLEALKVLMEKKLKELDAYPEDIAKEFRQVYSLAERETKILRKALMDVLGS